MGVNSGYRWIIAGVALITTVIGFMTWASAFPLLSLWVRDLGISRAQGGLLFGLFYVPGVLVALPASWLFNRYPLRRIFVLCWSLIAAGTAVMAVAPNFAALCVGRLLFSTGMNIHTIGTPRMLAGWFEGRRELGVIMAVYSTGVSLGVFCGIHLIGHFGSLYGWRAAMYLLVVLNAAGILTLTAVRQPLARVSKIVAPGILRSLRGPIGWQVWLLVCGYFFFNLGSDSFLAFTPDHLAQHGYTLDRASAIVGTYAWAAICVKLLSSPFLKAENAAYFVSIGCVMGALSIALLLRGYPLPAAISMGGAFGFAMPALYSLPAFMVGGERSGLTYGLFQFFYGFGILVQTLIGHLMDLSGGYVWSYALMAAFFGVGLVSIFSIRGFRDTLPIADPSSAERMPAR